MLPYSPLHHLLLAGAGVALVMTSGNVSDEPIAYRDDEALRAARLDRGPLPRARPPDRDAHGRLGAALGVRRGPAPRADAAALARARARQRRPARRCRCAGARVRRGAEEHLLRREGKPRLGRPPHRRPLQLRDAGRVPGGHRAFRAAVRGRAARRRARPASRLPVDRIRARARGRRARRRAAPPRPPRRRAGRARRAGAGGRCDLRRHGLRRGRHRLGRRAAVRRPARLRAGRSPAAGAPARRRAGDPPAVAHGMRLAARGAR